MKSFSRFGSIALLTGASLAGISAPAFGQAAPAKQETGLDEIVVTAQKREENLQQTPLAITAISAVQAELRGITEVKDISSLAPNVTVLQGTTNATAAIVTIRGINTAADESQGFDSPIGIYQDGIYIARASAASNEVADIERIEVLRGPQGTLFGRNTTGGAVNFISREPGHKAKLKLRAGYGNYNLLNLKGTVDTGDFADGLRMSFSAFYKRRDGTVDNLLQPRDRQDPGAFQTTGFRWATIFEPRSGIKVTNIFDYSRVKGINTASQLAAVGNGTVPTNVAGFPVAIVGGRPTITVNGGVFNLVVPANVGAYLAQGTTRIVEPGCPRTPSAVRLNSLCSEGALPYIDTSYGDLLRIEADLGGITIRSSSSGRYWRDIQTGTDLDGLGTVNGAALGAPSTTLNGFPAATLIAALGQPAGTAAFLSSQPVFTANTSFFQTDNVRNQNQFSQEIELISDGNEAFNWVIGGFYFRESGFERNPQNFGFVLDTNAAVYTTTNFGPGAPLLQAANPARFRVSQQTSTLGYRADGTSYAVYGQGTWRPGGKDGAFGVTLGLRYSWDRKHFDRFQNGPQPFATAADIALNDRRASFSAPTGNLTIDYRAAEDINLYARIARGYRSGGFNARQATSAATNFGLLPFNNEIIWSYEAGFKTEFSNRLRLNGAAFYNVYSDLQVGVPVPIQGSGSFGTAVANAGKVIYYGFELEGQFKLNDIFSIDGNVGYTGKKFREFNSRDDSAARVPTNIAAVISPAYSPDWTTTIAANARFPLGADGHVTARVGYNYTSSFILFNNAITAPFQRETNGDARGLVDAQLKFDGLKIGGGSDIGLTLWAKNLTNQKYRVRSVDFGALGFAYTVFGEPRTFGATLDIAF
ncbi:MAG: TonB-dependent receptor [Sphingomonadaceae bacterium]